MNYLRRLLRLVRNVDVASKYRGSDLRCFEDPINWFYLVKDADPLWRELELKGWWRHHLRGLRLVGFHSLEKFALQPSERNELYTPVPNGWGRESNRALRVTTPVMFSYLANHLSMFGARVWAHLVRATEVELELTTLGSFLRTVRRGVLNRSATEDMNRFCDNDDVLFLVSQGMVRQWLAMGIFRVLRSMHCNPILALLVIAW